MSTRVALVTDSTSGLADGTLAGVDVVVVPLRVLLDGEDLREGIDITAGEVGARLAKTRRSGTSRPSPRAFLTVYEELAARGVTQVVSIHVSSQLSGTWEAATLAARDAPIPVAVVDSAVVAGALGHCVQAAARAVGDGPQQAAVDRAVAAVETCGTAAVTLFYVHSLDHLRRGGRIGAASAFLGGALAVKPLLELADGHIEPVEKLRTQGRALARLQELAVEAARVMSGRPLVLVHHVDAEAKAEKFADKLKDALMDAGVSVVGPRVVPLPAALAVHVGPKAIGAVVCPND